MKFIISSIVVLAMFSVAFANPLNKPEVRSPSTSVSNNFTVTTQQWCDSEQTASLNAISTASLSSNYYLSSNQAAVLFYNSYYTQPKLQYINAYNGLSYIGDPTGKNAISTAMTTLMSTLTSGNSYLSALDSTSAAAITTRISTCASVQSQVITNMNACASTVWSMSISCGDTLYTSLSQFFYQAASISTDTIKAWSNAL